MRILDDLDGNQGLGPDDPSGLRHHDNNGNNKEQISSQASGHEPAIEDGQTGKFNETKELGARKLEGDPRKRFAGGTPAAEPPESPRGSRPNARRASDRLDELRLDHGRDMNSSVHVAPLPSSGGLWFILMVVLLGGIGAGAYLYLGLRNNNIALSQLPELLKSVTTQGGRIEATEVKLRDLSANWDGLTSRLVAIDRKVDFSLSATRNQTRAMVGQAVGHLQAELDQRSEAVDARLNNVESMQRQNGAQLAQLNDQLRDQVAGLREQLTAAQESTGRDLANMQQQVSENQGNMQTLTQNLHRDKMTFEIVRNSPTELAPGVALTVLKTDVSHQRLRGYIFLPNEGKTLWLNNVGAKEAVDFYAQQYSHPYSLIVTTVSNDGVVGYLLLPAGA